MSEADSEGHSETPLQQRHVAVPASLPTSSTDVVTRGHVSSLYIAARSGVPMEAVETIEAITGRGLDGDRYSTGLGYYSNKPGWGANVTLIQAEAIEAVNKGHCESFAPGVLRRNIVTSGVNLKSLIGRQFLCGSTVLYARKVFPPCAHLANLLSNRGVLKYFAHCGGIGADVIQGGMISVGDGIMPVAESL